ncbi:MAG: epimerase [Planctomycetes bacterium]|nr:epimerase [Planctomycetota bacterium]
MSSSRRDFLRTASAGAFLHSALAHSLAADSKRHRFGKSMKILVLGGTRFVGPHFVNQALARGHEITMFNRGRSNIELFPEVEKLVGNRFPDVDDGMSVIEKSIADGRRWDVVFDTSGYVPRVCRASAELLADACDHYTFISTLSVFSDRRVDVDEESPVSTLEDKSVERVTGATYGPLKALCEQACEAAMPGRVAHVRPGLIVGPLDNSDRFTWWPHRMAQGGETLAPGRPDGPIQIIDVRDLTEWCLDLAEQRVVGVFNAVGPASRVTMQEFLHGCKIVLGSENTFTWVDQQFLIDRQVSPYTEMPLWVPREDPPYGTAQCQKAMAAGLKFRPIGDTIRDTLAWSNTRAADHRWRAGMTIERETEILVAWEKAKNL